MSTSPTAPLVSRSVPSSVLPMTKIRQFRTWWASLSARLDERWPDEPEDNLPGR